MKNEVGNISRILGIDYGEKYVGLALSDTEKKMAFPLSVLSNDEKLIEEITKVCSEKQVEMIVIGESKNFLQKENEIMKKIHPFVKELEETLKIPVKLHPEFMTSVEAERLQGQNDMNDASAAALILTSYLDSNKHV